jgi:uncharacterized membrane protein
LVQTRKYTTRRERTHKGYRLQQHTFMKIVGCATYTKQSIRDVDLYGVWQPIHFHFIFILILMSNFVKNANSPLSKYKPVFQIMISTFTRSYVLQVF